MSRRARSRGHGADPSTGREVPRTARCRGRVPSQPQGAEPGGRRLCAGSSGSRCMPGRAPVLPGAKPRAGRGPARQARCRAERVMPRGTCEARGGALALRGPLGFAPCRGVCVRRDQCGAAVEPRSRGHGAKRRGTAPEQQKNTETGVAARPARAPRVRAAPRRVRPSGRPRSRDRGAKARTPRSRGGRWRCARFSPLAPRPGTCARLDGAPPGTGRAVRGRARRRGQGATPGGGRRRGQSATRGRARWCDGAEPSAGRDG